MTVAVAYCFVFVGLSVSADVFGFRSLRQIQAGDESLATSILQENEMKSHRKCPFHSSDALI